MKKKLTLGFALVLALGIVLSSCSLFGNNQTEDTPSGAGNKTTFSQIVVESLELDILEVRNAVFDLLGPISIVTDVDAAKSMEIVIGNTTRSITSAAASELEKLGATAGSGKYGYVIYSDGSSVCVYWQDDQLSSLALAKFITICIDRDKLNLQSGVIHSDIFDEAELVRDAKWLAIQESVSPEVYSALRAWYSNFDGSTTVGWLANLYDTEIGGFYYSNSARDNEPFRPDLESTYQTITVIKSMGAISDYNTDLPNDFRASVVAFVKSTQSSVDGYFYHAQWGSRDKLQVDRYGRDLTWATTLINSIKVDTDGDGVAEKQYPNYCAPSGLKCEEHSKNGGSCSTVTASVSGGIVAASSISRSILNGVSSAVLGISTSTVRPVAASAPDYSSSEAFIAWLEAYNTTIKIDSGNAHNIDAMQSDIIARGYSDELLDYLDAVQAEVWEEQEEAGEVHSGCWQYTADYKLVWGLHKYMTFYNNAAHGRSITYHKELIESCKVVILSPADKNYYVNDIMNMWTAISKIVSNAKTYNPSVVPELYETVKKDIIPLIEMTTEKLLQFRLENGTFTTDPDLTSRPILYGVSISLGVKEADVNANLLTNGLHGAIYTAIGVTSVPLCTSADGKLFVETVSTLDPIEKIPQDTGETFTFDDVTLDKLQNDYKISSTVQTSAFKLETLYDYDMDSEVLSYTSGIATNSNNRGDSLFIKASNSGGNCNVAEFDFLLAEVSHDSHLFQISLGNGFMFMIYKSGDYYKIVALSSTNISLGTEMLVNTSMKLRTDEWHTIRVEAYDPEEGETIPTIKFYIDEAHVATTNMYIGSKSGNAYNSTFTSLEIYGCAPVYTVLYLDNVYLNREYIELED